MEITNLYVWVTPDPSRVSRVVAMRRNGKWVEVYKGERIIVHHSQVPFLETKGFVKCEQDFSQFVFPTQEAAEQCDNKFIIQINENRL
jgi:hypothetical protein